MKDHRKYRWLISHVLKIYNDELSYFDEEFLKSARKQIGQLSKKQISYVDKILKKYFHI